jgi:phosphatidylglycerol---prolipoprotein diacylglyceryl transferase
MINSIQVGPIQIHFYGIIIMAGVIAAAYLAQNEAKRHGQNPALVWDFLVWVLIAGIIGARIWHILTPPPSFVAQGITTWYYITHPLDAIAIWNGGVGILGAVVGGVLALYLLSRKHHLVFLTWLDILSPAVALGQAIGRWGNFFNQELYGAPTNLPWAIYIDPQHRLAGFENQAYYHPVFLYESLWNLANMTLLLWLGRRFEHRLRSGDLFFIYLIIYPVGRFLFEFIRLDSSLVAALNANQAMMAIIALISIVALFLRHFTRLKSDKRFNPSY